MVVKAGFLLFIFCFFYYFLCFYFLVLFFHHRFDVSGGETALLGDLGQFLSLPSDTSCLTNSMVTVNFQEYRPHTYFMAGLAYYLIEQTVAVNDCYYAVARLFVHANFDGLTGLRVLRATRERMVVNLAEAVGRVFCVPIGQDLVLVNFQDV